MTTGSVLCERVDFEISGVFKLIWRCTYQSSVCTRNQARLGHGWHRSFSHRLELQRRRAASQDAKSAGDKLAASAKAPEAAKRSRLL